MPKQLAVALFVLGLAFAGAAFVIFGLGESGPGSGGSGRTTAEGSGSDLNGKQTVDQSGPEVGKRNSPVSNQNGGSRVTDDSVDSAAGATPDGAGSDALNDGEVRQPSFAGGSDIRDVARRHDPADRLRQPGSGSQPDSANGRIIGVTDDGGSTDRIIPDVDVGRRPSEDGEQPENGSQPGTAGQPGIRNPQLPPQPGNPPRPSSDRNPSGQPSGSGSGSETANPPADNNSGDSTSQPDPRLSPPSKVRFAAPSTVVLTHNASVVIPITYSAPVGTSMAGVQFDVTFPNTVLRFVGNPQLANFGNVTKQVASNEVSPGHLRIIIFGLDQNEIPTGATVKLTFAATRPAGQWSGQLGVQDIAATTPDAKALEAEAFGATLKFEG